MDVLAVRGSPLSVVLRALQRCRKFLAVTMAADATRVGGRLHACGTFVLDVTRTARLGRHDAQLLLRFAESHRFRSGLVQAHSVMALQARAIDGFETDALQSRMGSRGEFPGF